MKKILPFFIAILMSLPSHADITSTDFRDIGDIYTYTEEDTLYVFLEGATCPGTKDYFTINPSHMNNAKQLISMVLAAKMSKSKIKVLYDPNYNSTHCYFKGVILKN